MSMFHRECLLGYLHFGIGKLFRVAPFVVGPVSKDSGTFNDSQQRVYCLKRRYMFALHANI